VAVTAAIEARPGSESSAGQEQDPIRRVQGQLDVMEHPQHPASRPGLFPEHAPPLAAALRPLPDWAAVHQELRDHRKVNLTLTQLWIEYKEARAAVMEGSGTVIAKTKGKAKAKKAEKPKATTPKVKAPKAKKETKKAAKK
jgi:hypothetical protein